MAPTHFTMEPFSGPIELDTAALIIIDMQCDFLEPGGFGESLGNDTKKLQKAVRPCKAVLNAARKQGMLVLHTREGHRADATDLFPHKKLRFGLEKEVIGSTGPKGRVLIRGEPGHDIIPALSPQKGEPVIDKPGKGSFYGTDLEVILRAQGIQTLFVCGVTTEVCVHTTIREANDRGFHCIAVSDACASFFDEFHRAALKMIVAQQGIFGSTITSKDFVQGLGGKAPASKASTSKASASKAPEAKGVSMGGRRRGNAVIGSAERPLNPAFDKDNFGEFQAMELTLQHVRTRCKAIGVTFPRNDAEDCYRCLSWHIIGSCNANCSRIADHEPLNAEDTAVLVAWCKENWRV